MDRIEAVHGGATPKGLIAPLLYPSPSEAALKLQYIGKRIEDLPAPAVIVDAGVARRNCRLMLETARQLDLSFRAHVKTHKVFQPACLCPHHLLTPNPDHAASKAPGWRRFEDSQAGRVNSSGDREPAALAGRVHSGG